MPDLIKEPKEPIKFPYSHRRVELIQAIAKQLGYLVGEVPEDGIRLCLENIESAIHQYRKRRIKE